MGRFVCQIQDKGCGYAAVKGLLVYLGLGEGYAYAYEPKADKAPSLKEVISYARGLGLGLEGYTCLGSDEAFAENELPVLALVEEGGEEHLVGIYKRLGTHYLIADPMVGYRHIPIYSFQRKWTGIYLSISSIPIRFLPGKMGLSKAGELILLGFLSLLPTPFVLLGIDVLGWNWPCLYYLGLALGLYLLARVYLLSLMGTLSKRAEPYVIGSKDREKAYTDLMTYKQGRLRLPLSLAGLASLLMGLSYLTFSLGVKVGLYFLFLTAIIAFCEVFTARLSKYRGRRIAALERRFFVSGGEEAYGALAKKERGAAIFLGLESGFELLLLGVLSFVLSPWTAMPYLTLLPYLLLLWGSRGSFGNLIALRDGLREASRAELSLMEDLDG